MACLTSAPSAEQTTRFKASTTRGGAVGLARTFDGAAHAFYYSAERLLDLNVSVGLGSPRVINNRDQIAGRHDDRVNFHARGTIEFFGQRV